MLNKAEWPDIEWAQNDAQLFGLIRERKVYRHKEWGITKHAGWWLLLSLTLVMWSAPLLLLTIPLLILFFPLGFGLWMVAGYPVILLMARKYQVIEQDWSVQV